MHYKISGVASCVCTSGKVRHETTTAGGNEEFIWLDRRLCGQQNQRCVNIWSVMMESQLRSEAERKDHRSQTFRVYKCRSAYMDDTVIEVLELPYVAVSTAQRNGVAHRLIEGTSREETVISKRECLATPYVSRRGDGRYTSRYSSSRLCSIVPHQLAHLHYCKVSHWKLLNQRLHRYLVQQRVSLTYHSTTVYTYQVGSLLRQ